MPIYTYRCENCGHQFDKHQGFSDNPLEICPHCGKHKLHKIYFPAGVSFKGSGYYVTDKKNSSSISSSHAPKGKENGSKETSQETEAPKKKPEVKESSGEQPKNPAKE